MGNVFEGINVCRLQKVKKNYYFADQTSITQSLVSFLSIYREVNVIINQKIN